VELVQRELEREPPCGSSPISATHSLGGRDLSRAGLQPGFSPAPSQNQWIAGGFLESKGASQPAWRHSGEKLDAASPEHAS